jgi:CDP-glucose 4,6-dehydratase
MSDPFGGYYRGRTVLVTGHTGFKGSWLTTWLTELGASVIGYGLDPPTEPSNFVACRLAKRMCHVQGDVRDFARLAQTFAEQRPEVVFHLAAQALVRRSLSERRLTFDVNVMGTVNVLEAARQTESVHAVVMITSDKCYRNREWAWGYREIDELGGGHDPYSASKACAELVVGVYQDPQFQEAAPPVVDLSISSVRAGNVIGGGDWAADRIVPDTIRALASDTDVLVRRPGAVRPWVHVLESLSGYLWLGALMARHPSRYHASWNFGPGDGSAVTVAELVGKILDRWQAPASRLVIRPDRSATVETALMRLDCSKAWEQLRWRATWGMDQTLDATVAWYRRFYAATQDDMYPFTVEQIDDYIGRARESDVCGWVGSAEAMLS